MMEAYVLEWFQLIFRCLHLVTVIAWIGASFYFVWLDNHLSKPEASDLKTKGVDGELWAVHGGGFYNPQKYMVAPSSLPKDLHWFYWESYATWMSGIALFVVTYLWNAKTMMVDPAVHAMSGVEAAGFAVGFLVVGWLIYDSICRFFHKNDRTVAFLVGLLVTGAAYSACHIFSGRAAFLITGAMIATIMTANVFYIIIPGQRKVIGQMRAGKSVDPIFGQCGKQRSVHNTYLTLPVIFAMLANHFSFMTIHPKRWIVLVLMMLVGVLVRQYFVARHKGKQSLGVLTAAGAVLLAVAVWLAPKRGEGNVELPREVSFSEIEAIIDKRCFGCHSDKPTLIPEPGKNISFSKPGSIEANAAAIYVQVVQQKVMPLGNVTNMTDDERLKVKIWIESR